MSQIFSPVVFSPEVLSPKVLSPVIRKIDDGSAVTASAKANEENLLLKAEQGYHAQVDAIGDLLSSVCENALQAGPIWRPKIVVGQQPGISMLQALAPGWYWYDRRASDPFVGPFRSRIQAAMEAIDKSGIDVNLIAKTMSNENTNIAVSLLANYRKLIKHFASCGLVGDPYGDQSGPIFASIDEPDSFDATEVDYVSFIEPSSDDVEGIYVDTQDDPLKANFFSVFLHFTTGGRLCCGDFLTLAEAQLCAMKIDRLQHYAA